MHGEIVINYFLAISATASSDKNELIVVHDPVSFSDVGLGLRREGLTRNITGEFNPVVYLLGYFVHFNRIVDVSVTINPYLIIQLVQIGIDVFFSPVVLDDLGLIQNITQSKNGHSGWTLLF